MTDKQRRAHEAMEAARSRGLSLTEYARMQGLAVREIYDTLAGLRRRGVLPKSGRKARSKFVAVRVTQPVAVAMPRGNFRMGQACRAGSCVLVAP